MDLFLRVLIMVSISSLDRTTPGGGVIFVTLVGPFCKTTFSGDLSLVVSVAATPIAAGFLDAMVTQGVWLWIPGFVVTCETCCVLPELVGREVEKEAWSVLAILSFFGLDTLSKCLVLLELFGFCLSLT